MINWLIGFFMAAAICAAIFVEWKNIAQWGLGLVDKVRAKVASWNPNNTKGR